MISLVLLLNGHTLHCSPEIIKIGNAEEVNVIALIPNTTHLLQTLDKGDFSPLKSQWKKLVQSYTTKQDKAITRYSIAQTQVDELT